MSEGWLAIEMSQRSSSVAFAPAADAPPRVRTLEPPTDERDPLVPALDALLAEAGATPARIGFVAVSTGPGGFTGLRVAVATAKALALALRAQVVAVPSALVAARTLARAGQLPDCECGVALAAKADSVWLERVQVHGGVPHRGAAALAHPDAALLGGLACMLADNHLPDAWKRLLAAAGTPVVTPAWSAAACLEVGAGLFRADGATDPLRLEPIYPRKPEAVSLWEGRHGA